MPAKRRTMMISWLLMPELAGAASARNEVSECEFCIIDFVLIWIRRRYRKGDWMKKQARREGILQLSGGGEEDF